MNKYLHLWNASWARALAYRGDIFLWTFAEVAMPLVSLAVWFSVSSAGAGPFTPADTLTYYLVLMFVYSFTDVWNGFFLSRDILDGAVVRLLVRPVPIFWEYALRNLSAKAIRMPAMLVAFSIIFVLARNLITPAIFEPLHILLFAISLVGGLALAFWFDLCFAMLAFWFEDAIQIREYKEVVFNLAAGVLIPLAFMPQAVQSFFAWLPFRYIISAPIEILMGQVSGAGAVQLILAQAAWIVATVVVLRLLWIHGIKRYAVPGQ